MWMINVRMRRIDPLQKHARWEAGQTYKCYQGKGRTWMLTDAQVFDTELAATTALYDRLLEIYIQRRQQQIKFEGELNLLRAQVKALTPVRTTDAAFDRDAAFVEEFVRSMDQ